MQETLLSVHTARQTYDPARPFLPWLLALARRRVVDRLRRQGRSSARERPLTPADETFADDSANREGMDWSAKALEQAIAALPEAERRAITLLKLEEMTLAEAAQASGVSATSLKVASHRAIKRMRVFFQRLGSDQ